MLQQPYSIKLKPDDPFSLAPPRRVPIPLLRNMKAELEHMEGLGVISRIEEPTEWCSGMVPVSAENGTVQICVNLTHLNETVCREKYNLPSVEHLDRCSGLQKARCQQRLMTDSPESVKDATFITPFGRFSTGCPSA